MAAAEEIVAALAAPWEAAAAVLGVAASARTVVSLEARGVAAAMAAVVVKVVRAGAKGAEGATVVKVVAPAVTVALTAATATAAEMAAKVASRTPGSNCDCTSCTSMELLCTGPC